MSHRVNPKGANAKVYNGRNGKVVFDRNRPKTRVTLGSDAFSNKVRPDHEPDCSGFLRGNMQARFWWGYSGKGKPLWLDCGRHEIRGKVERWAHTTATGTDMCEVCERELEMLAPPSSKARQAERRSKWSDRMTGLGFDDSFIARIQSLDVDTPADATAETIREAVKAAEKALER